MRPIPSIAGAFERELRWLADARGNLTELFRETWEEPAGVGIGDAPDATFSRIANVGRARQVYLTETRPGITKGWHHHKIQSDRFVVVSGSILLVLYDSREGSPTRGAFFEVVLDPERNHRMVVIPPGVVHGWRNIGERTAAVLNLVTTEWDGSDEYRRGPHDGPADGVAYDWLARRDG